MRDIDHADAAVKKQLSDLITEFKEKFEAIYEHKMDIAVALHPDHPKGTDCLGCIVLAEDTTPAQDVLKLLGQAYGTMQLILGQQGIALVIQTGLGLPEDEEDGPQPNAEGSHRVQ